MKFTRLRDVRICVRIHLISGAALQTGHPL